MITMNDTKYRSCHDCLFENLPGDKEPCSTCMAPYDHFVDKKHPEFAIKWVKESQDSPSPDRDIGTVSASSDGSTANYYVLPEGATELQDIISAHNMNAQMGEIGRAWMRYGRCPHSPKPRDLKKIIFYAQAELDRIEKYES